MLASERSRTKLSGRALIGGASISLLIALIWLLSFRLIAQAQSCPTPRYGASAPLRGLDPGYTFFKEAGLEWVYVNWRWDLIETTAGACANSPQYPATPSPNCKWNVAVLGPDCDNPLCGNETGFGPESQQSPDQQIAEAQAAGLGLVVSVKGTPPWSFGPGCDQACRNDPAHMPSPTVDHFGDFMREAVRRYGSRVVAWQLWAEPNFSGNWLGGPQGYRERILAPGYDKIKLMDPNAKVAGPTIYRGTLNPPDQDLGSWVRNTQTQGDVVRNIDILSIHSYHPTVAQIQGDIDDANRFAQNNFVDFGRPIEVWVTEFGASSQAGCGECSVVISNETTIGNFIADGFASIGDSRWPLLKRMSVFAYHDRIQSKCKKGCRYGLLDVNGTRKQRYFQLKSRLTGS